MRSQIKKASLLFYFAPFFLLLPFLSACGSDPFRNAGECNVPGEYVLIEQEIAVCSGLEKDRKLYFEGPAYQAMVLLGKAEIQNLDWDAEALFSNEAESRGMSSRSKMNLAEISNDEIAFYADGDRRWDSLIEANAKRVELLEENEYAMITRQSMLNKYRAGFATREEAYEAQEQQLAVRDELDSALSIFESKLSVLRSDIKRRYGVMETLEVMLFIVARDSN